MRNLLLSSGMAVCLMLALAPGCSDKSSLDACKYETTMNLDKGNYDAVLQSSCASAMQLGAAYFGKAGYDPADVINRLVDANSAPPALSDLNIYMSSLVGKVTDRSVMLLDDSHAAYAAVPATADNYLDAQFTLGIVDAMKSLSLIKSLIDATGLGDLNTSCDANNNSIPDEVDAASSVLLISAATLTATPLISGVTVTADYQNIVITGKTGTYWGIVLQVSGTGGLTTTCPSPNVYKKLLFKEGTAWPVATVFPPDNGCTEGTRTWPCPLETGGQPVDLVSSIDLALTSSIDLINSSITSSAGSDVQQSVNDIKGNNCCTVPPENPLDPSACTCSQTELSDYLQTI